MIEPVLVVEAMRGGGKALLDEMRANVATTEAVLLRKQDISTLSWEFHCQISQSPANPAIAVILSALSEITMAVFVSIERATF